MNKENVTFARNLIKSINCGLDRLEAGSRCENDYLCEKIIKLYKLVFK